MRAIRCGMALMAAASRKLDVPRSKQCYAFCDNTASGCEGQRDRELPFAIPNQPVNRLTVLLHLIIQHLGGNTERTHTHP